MSGPQVVMGANLMCSFGVAPSSLVVVPPGTDLSTTPAGTIMDNAPIVNIPPFGMCSSPANPEVIAATAAALGVLTPMPCVPNIAGPWIPGNPKVMISNMPALDLSCKAMCAWGGVIQILVPGQMKVLDG